MKKLNDNCGVLVSIANEEEGKGDLTDSKCGFKVMLPNDFSSELDQFAALNWGLGFDAEFSMGVPVDPLEWQISQDTSNSIFAYLANTIGAAESVLRVAATGHDKRLFFKVIAILYLLASLGRLASGATIAYAGLCIFCLYLLVESSQLFRHITARFFRTRDTHHILLNILLLSNRKRFHSKALFFICIIIESESDSHCAIVSFLFGKIKSIYFHSIVNIQLFSCQSNCIVNGA
ncbi:uncharacterized protein LOC120252604 [Dioscorea cayenensis subsp. rotundata]|uniref:Uncharacterized protein LOC120252604 n=1 Tax=Dioscorea cayennensis subsp. rotundata TaxID=55577 RepID=A0AB40ANZ2_DIOCR|nr:uncharacterized protein LOC120252604 [Dioscorea cayenensis subsp. rotundata]